MKNYKLSTVLMTLVILGFILAVLAGCWSPLGGNPRANLDSQGKVVVNLPPYAPWLGSLMDKANPPGSFTLRSLTAQSRAFLVADYVVLTVFNSSSVEVSQKSFNPSSFYFAEDGNGTVEYTLTLEEGTGYTIRADIYNLDESDTEPMVSGMSTPFAILAGADTPVAITCTPLNPTTLVLDTQESFNQVSSVIDEQTGEPASLGGETWVSAVAPSNGLLLLNVDLPEGSYLGMGLYDSEGRLLTNVNYNVYPGNQGNNLLSGDGYIQFSGLTPSEIIYLVFVLIDDGGTENFSINPSSPSSISGTITVSGITNPDLLPGLNQVILVENSLDDPWISNVGFGEPVVDNGNLVYYYTLPYSGMLDGVVFGVMVNNGENWPLPGDYFGATDREPGTPMDFITGAGIEPTHFSGNVTNINFTLQQIAATPIPASAFPDPALRAAMEAIIGKSFTGVQGGVTDADLMGLTNALDFSGSNEAYSDLTGLELCDNVSGLVLNGHDLSGCDLGTAAGGNAYEALAGMDSLGSMQLP